MATSRDAPNPLRPYYIPPSIGLPPDSAANGTTVVHGKAPSPSSVSKPSFGTHARDILQDLDYGDYLSSDSSPTMADMTKRLLDQALWNYTSVLLAQPFEVAKTVLQCHLAAAAGPAPENTNLRTPFETPTRRASSFVGKFDEYPSDDSDNESASYFSSTAPRTGSYAPPSIEQRRRTLSRSSSTTPIPPYRPSTPSAPPAYKLDIKRHDSLFEVLGQLWTKESAWGVWKGTNATFVYNFLLKTIESWTRSMLSALLNVPDPGLLGTVSHGVGGIDILDSPSPLASLGVAVAAAGFAGFLLAPLDIVRTRLILTPTTQSPRALVPSLRTLPSLTVPSQLVPITFLHSSIPTLVSASTPLFLRNAFRIDPLLTPATYSISSFAASLVELFLKLPLETVLRRGQVHILRQHSERSVAKVKREKMRDFRGSGMHGYRPNIAEGEAEQNAKFNTVVDCGPYKGVFGTMWFVTREEGTRLANPLQAKASSLASSKSEPQTPARGMGGREKVNTKMKKGQGMDGLWRGWRVGFWGLVGVWGAAALGGSGGGGEF